MGRGQEKTKIKFKSQKENNQTEKQKGQREQSREKVILAWICRIADWWHLDDDSTIMGNH